jgi:hypothetical protein
MPAAPFWATFGSQGVSSSDGQHIHLGDGGEVAGGVNGRYGTNPIIKLYTHISGRYPCKDHRRHGKRSGSRA